MRESPFARFLPFLPTLVLASSMIVLALGGEEVRQLLRYERSAIDAGEVWRLFSGHLVHFGWSHLWLNVAGLALVSWLAGSAYGVRGWLGILLVCAAGTSAALYLLNTDVSWYVGLSGVLHGLLVAGVVATWDRYPDAKWILALVAVKLMWEQALGPLPGSEDTVGGPVIVDAHLYGAASGLLAALATSFVRRLSRRAAV